MNHTYFHKIFGKEIELYQQIKVEKDKKKYDDFSNIDTDYNQRVSTFFETASRVIY